MTYLGHQQGAETDVREFDQNRLFIEVNNA